MGIRPDINFGKYLGFPIFHKKPEKGDFQFLIDNLNNKLAGWKTKFLNMTGRVTLAKSSLANIPNYVMQYINLPTSVQKIIDKSQRNCMWGTTNSKRKMHLLGWDTITLPKRY